MQNLRQRAYDLLRWSEQYMRTDMVYLAKGGFWMTLGQAVSSIVGFFLAISFANFVSPDTYGTYKYILSIAGIFALFTLPGLGTAFSRAVAKEHENIIRAIIKTRIAYSLIGSFFALIGSAYYFLNDNVTLSTGLAIIAISLPFFDVFDIYGPYFAGKRRFDQQTKYNAISHIVSAGVLIATIAVTDNLITILLAYFVPLSAIRLVIYLRTVRDIPRYGDDRAEEETSRYGKQLTLIGILGTIAGQIDKILLWKFLGPIELAIYSFAIAMPNQIKGPLKGVGELAFPKFASQTTEEIKANLPALYRKVALYGIILFSASIAYILAAPFIFSLFFPNYMESVLYSQILALSLVSSINTIPKSILESQKIIKYQYAISIMQPLTLITLLAILIPYWGILGAIISLTTSRFAVMFSSFALMRKALR